MLAARAPCVLKLPLAPARAAHRDAVERVIPLAASTNKPLRVASTVSSMPERELPQPGEVWVKRKTGERFEVWSSFPRWVIVYPLREGNRRQVHVITNNFLQEYVAEADAG